MEGGRAGGEGVRSCNLHSLSFFCTVGNKDAGGRACGCPPPCPSLAAVTSGMKWGPLTGGSQRNPMAQSTSVVNLENSSLFA